METCIHCWMWNDTVTLRNSLAVQQKIKQLPYDPEIPLLSIYPTELKTYIYTHIKTVTGKHMSWDQQIQLELWTTLFSYIFECIVFVSFIQFLSHGHQISLWQIIIFYSPYEFFSSAYWNIITSGLSLILVMQFSDMFPLLRSHRCWFMPLLDLVVQNLFQHHSDIS